MNDTATTPSRFRLPASVRWTLLLALALTALAYMLPMALTQVIGRDTLRAQAQAALAAALDRQVRVGGEVRLTTVPWCGLRVADISVESAGQPGQEPLLRVDVATIGLKLLDLARLRVTPDSIALSTVNLNLRRDAQGRDNWSVPAPAPGQPDLSGVAAPPAGLRVWNASVVYDDALTGQRLELTRLNLDIGQDSPFAFALSCEARATPLGLRGELRAQGRASLGEDGRAVFVRDSRAEGFITLPGSGQDERVNFSGNLAFHGEYGALEIAGLVLDGLGARVTGRINAAGLYEDQPWLQVELAASARRDGAWPARLGLDRKAAKDHFVPADPAFRQPESPEVNAALSLAVSPGAWNVSRLTLRDGPGALNIHAAHVGGETTFDATASGLNLGAWLPEPSVLSRGVGLLSGGGTSGKLSGRFAGTGLRLGPLELVQANAEVHGQNGETRIYPISAQGPHALFSGDARLDAAGAFQASARLQALLNGNATSPPASTPSLDLTISGTPGGVPGTPGVNATLSLKASDPAQDWSPPWMDPTALAAWRALGAGSIAGNLRTGQGGADAWEVTGLDFKTAHSHLMGRIQGRGEQVELDLNADKLDLERLLLVAGAIQTESRAGSDTGGQAAGHAAAMPRTLRVEGKLAAKRLSAFGFDMDDAQATGVVTPLEIHLPSLTGTALGGKFQAGLDVQDWAGRRQAAAQITASGVQGAQLSALFPQMPRLLGQVDAKASVETAGRSAEDVLTSLRGQVEAQLGQGTVTFASDGGAAQPWPVTKATANLKFAARAPAPSLQAPPQGHAQPAPAPEKPREAALLDVNGTLKLDSPGAFRSTQAELKAQAGLDASGKPLWLRQPRLDAVLLLEPPFVQPGKGLRATCAGKLDADLEKGSFSLSGADIQMAGIAGKATVSGQSGPHGTTLAGSLDIGEFNPREAARALGLNLPPGAAQDAWQKARFSAELGGSLREVRLSRVNAQLDSTTATGSIAVSGAKTKLDLRVNALDMDRLAPSQQNPDAAKRPETPLPLSTLRELNMEAKLHLGKLVKDKLVWDDCSIDLSALGGRLTLSQKAGGFYGGPYALNLRADARGTELTAQLELRITGAAAMPLLDDLAGGGNLTRGLADFSLNVETRGATDRALRAHAAGAARWDVHNGRLVMRETADKEKAQRQAAAQSPNAVQGDQAPPQPQSTSSEGLTFQRMGSSFSIREGLGITRDFVLVSPQMDIKGDGWVSLVDERIDLSLMASVKDVGELPVRVSGPLYDPRLDIDKSRLLSDTIMNLFKGVISIPGTIMNQLRKVF